MSVAYESAYRHCGSWQKGGQGRPRLKAIPEGLQAVPEWLQCLKVQEQGLGSVRSVERPIEAANSHCRIDESGRGGGGNCAADHPLDGRDSRAWNEPEIQIERACEFDQAGQTDILLPLSIFEMWL